MAGCSFLLLAVVLEPALDITADPATAPLRWSLAAVVMDFTGATRQVTVGGLPPTAFEGGTGSCSAHSRRALMTSISACGASCTRRPGTTEPTPPGGRPSVSLTLCSGTSVQLLAC